MLVVFAPAVRSQSAGGVIDLRADAAVQIEQIESILEDPRDMPAPNQVVFLRWLIELYEFVGEIDKVEPCYRRILSFYPYDVGTLNAYARFLFEQKEAPARAESLLYDATLWGKYTDARSLDRGHTFELLSRVELAGGRLEEAIRDASTAIALVDEESAAGPLRVLAEAYVQSGAFDQAADTYLELIALERGLIPEDINALKLFADRSKYGDAGDLNDVIAKAVERKNEDRRRRLEATGAEQVVISSDDGVRLEASLRRGHESGPGGAVLFIHDLGGTRSGFVPSAELLFVDGVTTLSVDLRAHGGSRTDSLRSIEDLTAHHAEALVDDVIAGYRYLAEKFAIADGRIVIVAAGRSCALVEKALYRGHLSAPVVYLSPVFDREDRGLRNAIAFHTDLPILVLYSTEDFEVRRTLQTFTDVKSFPQLDARPLSEAGHGIDVLRRDPAALERFREWILESLAGS